MSKPKSKKESGRNAGTPQSGGGAYASWLKSSFKNFKELIKNQDLLVIILVILVIANTVLVTKLLDSHNVRERFYLDESEKPVAEIRQSLQFRALDGLPAENGATSTRPLAVVIENHFESWPQTGIAEANLVYEFLTEGGVTRFLALYDQSSKIEKIGPVRSCRPYFLNIAEEFQALHTHIGGSPECLDLIKKRRFDVFDLDEYTKTDYFWRASDRDAPHNVYTSIDLMAEYLKDKEIPNEYIFESWKYYGDSYETTDKKIQVLESPPEPTASKISIDFSTYTYNVEWIYNKESYEYIRYLTGDPQKDSSGSEIRARNIVIQRVKARVLDSKGRLSLAMQGRGDALIFQDGQVIEGHWKKSTPKERTRFYSANGEEIEFNRGITWVEVVPTDREVSYE